LLIHGVINWVKNELTERWGWWCWNEMSHSCPRKWG